MRLRTPWLLGAFGGLLLAWFTGQALGAALVVLGLLVLAALGGWSYGRRTPAPGARAPA